MRKSSTHLLVGGLALAVLSATGCALFVAGAGAGAGVGAGSIAYYGNELCTSREVTVDRAWEAGHAAMKEMQFAVIPAESRKDATGGMVVGRNASDQLVRIKLTRQTDDVTRVRVRVGTFSTPDNRNAAQLLFEKMSKHF